MKSRNPRYAVLVIDEEAASRERLCTLLEIHAPDFRVAASFTSMAEAKPALARVRPALVFYSVEQHCRPDPELRQTLRSMGFQVILTSSSGANVFEAFKIGALDLLLKPIDQDDLANALARFRRYRPPTHPDDLRVSVNRLPSRPTMLQPTRKLMLPIQDSTLFLNVADILFIRGKKNQTTLHFKDDETLTTSRNLRYFEQLLPDHLFFRVHSTCLVNLTEISEYSRKEGGKLILSNGERIRISRLRRSKLFKLF